MDTKHIILIILAVILLLLLGFFIGRKTVKVDETVVTEYITLDPIHDTITNLIPAENPPVDTCKIIETCVKNGTYSELFPTKVITDTIIFTNEDTTKILKDWATERFYSNNLFDIDTIGNCSIDINVQYNRIKKIEYTFTPIQKQTEITKIVTKKFEPFIGIGVLAGIESSNGKNKLRHMGPELEIGTYIKEHHGVALQYQYELRFRYDNDNVRGDVHKIGVKYSYKF